MSELSLRHDRAMDFSGSHRLTTTTTSSVPKPQRPLRPATVAYMQRRAMEQKAEHDRMLAAVRQSFAFGSSGGGMLDTSAVDHLWEAERSAGKQQEAPPSQLSAGNASANAAPTGSEMASVLDMLDTAAAEGKNAPTSSDGAPASAADDGELEGARAASARALLDAIGGQGECCSAWSGAVCAVK